MCLICNGMVAVVKSSSVKIEALGRAYYKTMHMARFDMKFPPGSAARKGYRTSLPNNQSVRRSVAAAIFAVSEHCSYNRSIVKG